MVPGVPWGTQGLDPVNPFPRNLLVKKISVLAEKDGLFWVDLPHFFFRHRTVKPSAKSREFGPVPSDSHERKIQMAMSENGLYTPNEIASHFSKRDNDQQNQWVSNGYTTFSVTHPYII